MTDFTPMTKEAAQEWIDALPKYKKGKGMLKDCDGAMCCLGVLADIKGAWDYSDDVQCEVDGSLHCPDTSTLNLWGIDIGEIDLSQGKPSRTGAQLLMYVNDASDTFAPVIAEIKRMFIDGEA